MRTKLNTPVVMALMAAALVLSLLPPRLAAEQPDGQSQRAPEHPREPSAVWAEEVACGLVAFFGHEMPRFAASWTHSSGESD